MFYKKKLYDNTELFLKLYGLLLKLNDEANLNFKHNADVNIDRSKNVTQQL